MANGPDPSRMKAELARLVGIDTENPPGREHEAAELVADLLAAAGFETALDPFAPGRTNVVARLDNGPGPLFAFNTHLDVVPAGDGWSSPPFALRERGGSLFGRGACDAKGALIAMIEAMRLLAAARRTWSGTLVGAFVADEEVASAGARRFVASAPPIDHAIIGEPTSNATVIAHKGSLRPVVRVHGTTAHSGTPELGDNAIYRAGRLIALVEQHHEAVVCRHVHPLVGKASLTVTRIQAGVADNVIPDRCDLLLDRRLVPGEEETLVRREIQDLLAAAAKCGIRAEVVDYRPTTGGASETPREAPIVVASLAAGRRNGARSREPLGFQGGCDLVHFRGVGAAGTVIGPGSLAVAHKPDEFVPVDEFIAASRIYRDVALAMLGGG